MTNRDGMKHLLQLRGFNIPDPRGAPSLSRQASLPGEGLRERVIRNCNYSLDKVFLVVHCTLGSFKQVTKHNTVFLTSLTYVNNGNVLVRHRIKKTSLHRETRSHNASCYIQINRKWNVNARQR